VKITNPYGMVKLKVQLGHALGCGKNSPLGPFYGKGALEKIGEATDTLTEILFNGWD
jgi:hypothetical protein